MKYNLIMTTYYKLLVRILSDYLFLQKNLIEKQATLLEIRLGQEIRLGHWL